MPKLLFDSSDSPANLYLKNFLLSLFCEHIKDISTKSILEIGIGNGRFGKLLYRYFQSYYGVDPDREYVEIAQKENSDPRRVFYRVGSAKNIPFHQNFDIIFFALSWHFVRDKDVLKKITSLLSEQGVIVIMEPTEQVEKWASPKLQKESSHFNWKLYAQKIKNLKEAADYLSQQDFLHIKEQRLDQRTKFRFWVLAP